MTKMDPTMRKKDALCGIGSTGELDIKGFHVRCRGDDASDPHKQLGGARPGKKGGI